MKRILPESIVSVSYTHLDVYKRQEQHLHNHVFYFAVAPRFFAVIAKGLEQVEKACTGKVIIEKPFGEDLESARVLNEDLERFFTKERMFHKMCIRDRYNLL